MYIGVLFLCLWIVLFVKPNWSKNLTNQILPARQDSPTDVMLRTARSRITIVYTEITRELATENHTNRFADLREVSSSIAAGTNLTDYSFFYLSVATNLFWIALNPQIELWRNPTSNSGEVSAYWQCKLFDSSINMAGYVGIQFGGGIVFLTNLPPWRPVYPECPDPRRW